MARSTGLRLDFSDLFGQFLHPSPTPEVAQGCLAVVVLGPVAGWESVCLWLLLLIADAV